MAPVTPMWIAGRAVTTGRNARGARPVPRRCRRPRADRTRRGPSAPRWTPAPPPACGSPAPSGRGSCAAIAARIEVERDEIAVLITRESGLSLKEQPLRGVARPSTCSRWRRTAPAATTGRLYAGDIGRNGQEAPHRLPARARRARRRRSRHYNHPLNQVVHKVAPAVAAGAPVVLKPSEKTPAHRARLRDASPTRPRLPGAMLSVLTGDPAEICDVCWRAPGEASSFPSPAARAWARRCGAGGYRRVVNGAGGQRPLIVIGGRRPRRGGAARPSPAPLSRNSPGQRCTAVKRVLAQGHHRRRPRRADGGRSRAPSSAAIPDRRGEPTSAIPLPSDRRRRRPSPSSGGSLPPSPPAPAPSSRSRATAPRGSRPALFRPRAWPDAPLVMEETFGPVAPVIRFRTVDEALAIANGTAFGLSAGLCNASGSTGSSASPKGLEVGGLNVGEVPGYRTELSPFGGVKGFRPRPQGRRGGGDPPLTPPSRPSRCPGSEDRGADASLSTRSQPTSRWR